MVTQIVLDKKTQRKAPFTWRLGVAEKAYNVTKLCIIEAHLSSSQLQSRRTLFFAYFLELALDVGSDTDSDNSKVVIFSNLVKRIMQIMTFLHNPVWKDVWKAPNFEMIQIRAFTTSIFGWLWITWIIRMITDFSSDLK